MPTDRRSSSLPPRSLSLLAGASLLLAGCSGGGSDSTEAPTTPTPIDLASLSGIVRADDGTPLPFVEVSVGGVSAQTDPSGRFVVGFPELLPAEDLQVDVDPSGTTIPGNFPDLAINMDVTTGGADAVVPYVLHLPDLSDTGPTGKGFGTFNASAPGVLANPLVLQDGPDLRLSLLGSTFITLGGLAPVGQVEFSIRRVDPLRLPYPAFNGLIPAGYVAIGPFDATFDPAGSLVGASVLLPNDGGFPLGTELAVFAYDEELRAWVNRSAQTGRFGFVVSTGGTTAVDVTGVVTEGGLYTAGAFVSATCTTTVAGQLLDTSGAPMIGASVAVSSGQFGLTDGEGRFSIPLVPALNYAALAGTPALCVAEPFQYVVTSSPLDGGVSTTPIFNAGAVPGGTTDLGSLNVLPPADSATLVGLLTGSSSPSDQLVELDGPNGPIALFAPPDGQFFLTGIEPGLYVASTTFAFADGPTTALVEVDAGQVGVLTLSPEGGVGTGSLTAFVGLEDGSRATPPTPLAGAEVLLFGTDPSSVQGILRTTDENGLVSFDAVDGPFTVSAQRLVGETGQLRRLATSLIGVEAGSTARLLLEDIVSPATDGTLDGTVADLPAGTGTTLDVAVLATASGDVDGRTFRVEAPVDAADGSYSLAVPSGLALELALVVRDAASGAVTAVTLAAGDVAPLDPAGSATVDLSAAFNPLETAVLDRPTSISLGGVLGAGSVDVALEFELPGASDPSNARRVLVDLGSLGLTGGTLDLPDAALLTAGGYALTLRLSATDGGPAQRLSAPLTTTDEPLSFGFDAPPALISPVTPQAGAGDLEDSTLELQIGTGLALDTLVRVRLGATGASIAKGLQDTNWTVFAPADALPLQLPTLPLDMWGDGSVLAIDATTLRTGESGPSLAELATLETQLDLDLDQESSSATSNQVSIGVVGG